MMKRLALMTSAAAMAFAAASPASAATIQLYQVGNTLAGVFGAVASGSQGTDTYTFSLPSAGSLYASVDSLGYKFFLTNLDFTSVTLNGAPLNVNSTGNFESRSITESLSVGGLQTLVVSYKNAQPLATYGGVITFSPSAVPEPAAWALMILGFGAIGGALRYRRRSADKVRFAI